MTPATPARILLDTHILVWSITAPSLLSPRAKRAIDTFEVIVSAASLWEMIVSRNKRDAIVEDPVSWWEDLVEKSAIKIVGIQASHIRAVDQLPHLHKDPFDRILVAQAIVEKAVLLTHDKILRQYPVSCIW